MSKIGKMPVEVKEGISVSISENQVVVVGPKGTLSFLVPEGVTVEKQENKIIVRQKVKNPKTDALFGLTRAEIANIIEGVEKGFEKKLELQGVGYRAQITGNDLVLSLGFSHPVKVPATERIKFGVSDNIISVWGTNKAQVGDIAAKIRAIRPPEPYKGKGIRYVGEKIRRKSGKAAKAVGTK